MIELYTKVGKTLLERPDPFFQFPDGQWHMKYADFAGAQEVAYVCSTDANDYLKLKLWDNCLSYSPNIVIPYFPGARSDRGKPLSAAMYTQLIPDYKNLVLFDVHSNYVLNYFEGTRRFAQDGPIHVTPAEFLPAHLTGKYDGIIAPDKGAVKRAGGVADALGIGLYTAEKTRDFDSGKLTGFDATNLPLQGKYLIVDDICDGGGTFNGLAETWRETGFEGEVDLYVSHGIFSKGFSDLADYFGKIITTDSFFNKDEYFRRWAKYDSLEVLPVKKYLLNKI